MSTLNYTRTALTDEFKIPGFTGHVHLLKETFGKTPVIAQMQAADAQPGEFLYSTRTRPGSMPERDPCNFPDTYLPTDEPQQLWPCKQDSGRQPSAKPVASTMVLGDPRLNFQTRTTNYRQEYAAPLPGFETLRSPLRSKVPRQQSDFAALYASAARRVDDARLDSTLAHMRERLQGKLSSRNDNAFKLRKVFKMWDIDHCGTIGTEDFRMMTESVGIQLDDDSLLAVFRRYDPECSGTIEYMILMRDVLDEDMFSLYHS
ncbi:hypothetical protein WJX73_000088 [Symbiochloris irregularis]|uniref:EF-hand domain-containing protein n=1 Tax=Symbiochloris irregularis TaxID=706552 RepID=A0AAW1P5L6_9CHLO